MFGRLHILERGRPERVVEITGTATIGRTSDNDIILESDGVSHSHAMLLPQHGALLLVDLGSTFGTFVDTILAPPDEPVSLADGAEISIGRAALRYVAPRARNGQSAAGAALHPPALAAPHLNTRLDLPSDQPIPVGRRVVLRVWVGPPIATDERQSSRPLEWRSLDDEPLALRVHARVASPAWRVVPEQPTLLAVSWGTVQVACFHLLAPRAERTRMGLRVDLAESRVLLQYVRLGLRAGADSAGLTCSVGQPEATARCERCGARLRPGARFCTRCGARRV